MIFFEKYTKSEGPSPKGLTGTSKNRQACIELIYVVMLLLICSSSDMSLDVVTYLRQPVRSVGLKNLETNTQNSWIKEPLLFKSQLNFKSHWENSKPAKKKMRNSNLSRIFKICFVYPRALVKYLCMGLS